MILMQYNIQEAIKIIIGKVPSVFFSREYDTKYSYATLTNFIKRIHFDLKVLNYLASEYQYKHYIFLQPSLFSSNSQYKLLMNSKTPLTSIDQLSKMK